MSSGSLNDSCDRPAELIPVSPLKRRASNANALLNVLAAEHPILPLPTTPSISISSGPPAISIFLMDDDMNVQVVPISEDQYDPNTLSKEKQQQNKPDVSKRGGFVMKINDEEIEDDETEILLQPLDLNPLINQENILINELIEKKNKLNETRNETALVKEEIELYKTHIQKVSADFVLLLKLYFLIYFLTWAYFIKRRKWQL